jgi:hypothetical protein
LVIVKFRQFATGLVANSVAKTALTVWGLFARLRLLLASFRLSCASLQVVADQDRMRGPLSGGMQQVGIFQEAMRRLDARLTPDEEQALLTAWYALFRSGHLSWGYNLNNPDPSFCHVTE